MTQKKEYAQRQKQIDINSKQTNKHTKKKSFIYNVWFDINFLFQFFGII